MARTATFNTNKAIGKALRQVETGEISRFLALQLVEKGFVKVEVVRADHRGRPAHRFELTGKGRFAKNWGGKADNLVRVVAETEEPEAGPVLAHWDCMSISA